MSDEVYARYVLFVLTLVYTLNYIDRGLITLLLPGIQADLKLTDSELGFLTGIAFGLFYATLGIPIARWADRGDRGLIAALAIGLWGVTVMGCLWVGNFAQFALARAAAAVGEAGCMPPTYSLVGDYFPQPARRTRAMSLYMLANPASVLLSFMLGGWLVTRFGWRLTFFLMGVPGLLLAIVVRLTVRDPRKAIQPLQGSAPPPHLWHLLAGLGRRPAVRHLGIGVILLLMIGMGLGPWYATFLTRYHALPTDTLGYALGVIFSVGGVAGIALGGYLSTKWCAHDERRQIRGVALAVACLFPALVVFLLAPGSVTAMIALAVLWILFNFSIPVIFALFQRLTPPDTRATSLALLMMLSNLIGMGVGPQIVGLLSDRLRVLLGADSLRYAMLTLSFVSLWAAHHFRRVGIYVQAELAEMGS